MGNSAAVDKKTGMFVQKIMFPEQETLLGRFISDGQLKKKNRLETMEELNGQRKICREH